MLKHPFKTSSLSEDYFDLNSILSLLWISWKKNIIIDLVVLMTENFLRKKNLHDGMIEKTIQNNYDALLVVKNEELQYC